MAASVDTGKCVGCESCVGQCPVEAITMVNGKSHIDESKCVECGTCVAACPAEAISL